MSTAKLFNRQVRANKSPRNAFSMDYSTLFTTPVGMLLPAYHQHVRRGDKLKGGCTSLVRTNPLITPAFMSFDQKLDFWFVPYKLIWSDYENWQIGQTYRHRTTNLKGAGKQNFLPFTSFKSIAQFIDITNRRARSNYEPSVSYALRLLDLMGYSTPIPEFGIGDGTFSDSWTLISNSDTFDGDEDRDNPIYRAKVYFDKLSTVTPCNYFALAAFQCIYQNAYRNEEYEVLDPSYYNVDNLFSNLEYDNDVLGDSVTSTPSYLSAYENPSSDKISLYKLFTPRYKNWRYDVFTTVKPDAGFNLNDTGLEIGLDESAQSNTYGSGFYWPTQDQLREFPLDEGNTDSLPGRYNPTDNLGASGDYPYNTSRQDWTFQSNNYNGSNNPANVFQVLTNMEDPSSGNRFALLYPQNIRNLMAQDKFSRSAIYADKNISAQIKALFGENYEDPHRPIYLGSFNGNIQITDVTATSDGQATEDGQTSTSILGQLAGKVRQEDGDGNIFTREFHDDGIVIGVHYIMPRNNYDSYRLNKWNTKVSRFDYFFPQFDGLGYQPVLAYERNIPAAWQHGIESNDISRCNSLFGFTNRYYEYKQRTNEVHGTFMTKQPEFFWTLTNNPAYIPNGSNSYNYKIYPDITNRIFTSDYDGSVASDPFKCYFFFNMTLVSDMEIYGTPSL